MALPTWLRALLAADRGFSRLAALEEIVRDELAFAAVAPERRAEIVDAIYDQHRAYLPGGRIFEGGLFDWEKRALDHAAWPRRGRILVAGAGAGRECKALVDRGYDVIAFEPCRSFFEALRTQVPAYRGSYRDLLRAREGALAPLFDRGPYDGVLLGWSSLAHVIDEDERARILETVRTIAPTATAMASFVLVETSDTKVRSALRRLVRGTLAPLGAHTPPRRDEAFFPGAGFARGIERDELARIAGRAGYDVVEWERTPCPHALLRPR